jgi:peptide/nickel transport system substrate-binding protein
MPDWRAAAVLGACLLGAAACSAPTIEVPFAQGAADTATPAPILPTAPPPPKVLVVCLAEEPNTLYLYDSPNASAQALLPALYDGPFDVRGYQYQPVILEDVPSAEAGTVRLETVSLASGDLYLNPESMLPETLAPGKPYLPSGCTSPDCARRFEGGQAQFDREIVEFTLLPDLTWSDGTPLTAGDSVFSFNLDADPDTPSLKDQVNRTASYEAVDDRTVRWTGIPGYFDPEPAGDFWTPLPEHLLGSVAPGDLPQSEAARQSPVGWGPYMLERWVPGESLEFVPNPNYRRREDGMPAFDRLEARILKKGTAAAIQQVLTGECDVLDESLLDDSALATLAQLSGDPRLKWTSTPGDLLERLDFDTAPTDGRPPVLASSEVRRALASCIDRQGLIDLVVSGLSPVPQGMIAAGNPLAPTETASIVYSPASANDALTSLGWVDHDGQAATPRVAQGVAGIVDGTPLTLSLLTAPGAAEESLAHAIADDLAHCGVAIDVESVPADQLYAPWPDGPAFGRSFDLVLWPWLEWVTPSCELFTSAEVGSSGNAEGSNASGFADAAYDAACAQARLGPMAGAAFSDAVRETQTILDQAVPTLPLLQWPRLLVAGERVCGLNLDPTAPLLWNIEDLTPGPSCAP